MQNYLSYQQLIKYAKKELSFGQMKMVKKIVDRNPHYQEMLNGLDRLVELSGSIEKSVDKIQYAKSQLINRTL